MSEDYIRTARSKGLKERVVLIRHALRNALLPSINLISLNFASLLGGAEPSSSKRFSPSPVSAGC